MDFENAAQRLKRDQSKLKGRKSRVPEISAKAKREAQLRKQQQQRAAAEREKQKRQAEFLQDYYRQCERSLGVKQLSTNGNLLLKATSIHGEGDKIALPPSVLQFLTQSGNDHAMTSGSPWIFRIGILHPQYTFPASPLLKNMHVPTEDEMDDDDDMEDDDENDSGKMAYLDELRHRYITYTHGTVVEFTQEEEQIGLPGPIAAALLDNSTAARQTDNQSNDVHQFSIPVTRTVDPAKRTTANSDSDNVESPPMETNDDNDDNTPGHPFYGGFDVPDLPVEVSLVKIPKGKACKLQPTADAITNGFYQLKDVKLVLEQSLIRTRATLSVGDLVHTWHRGVKYDLKVTQVTPSTYQTVTCINTDIEVDFEEASMPPAAEPKTTLMGGASETESKNSAPVSTGYTLGSSADATTPAAPAAPVVIQPTGELPPEPPATQTEGVLTVQIRANGRQGRRRFDVGKNTVEDLFAFAATLAEVRSFVLVTRFPRRVFRVDDNQASATLQEKGLQAGQELFMVEKL